MCPHPRDTLDGSVSLSHLSGGFRYKMLMFIQQLKLVVEVICLQIRTPFSKKMKKSTIFYILNYLPATMKEIIGRIFYNNDNYYGTAIE